MILAPSSPNAVREAAAGLRDIAPAAVAAVPIGLLFGAVAQTKGLSALEVALMSTLVFAGGAQLAAIEMWSTPVPVAAVVLSTLLVNARHLLMGASLTPKTRAFSPLQRYLGFFFITDEAWALAERRATRISLTPTYWFAVAALLPLAWVGSSTIGATIGALMGDPARFGADFAFTALFIGLIAGFNTGSITAVTVAASAITAALVSVTLGPPWHVLAGAAAGVTAAFFSAPGAARI